MEAELKNALEKDLTVSVGMAARVLGIGRNQAYEACRCGEIESFRIGKKIVIPTAPLRKKLGIEAAA